MKKIIKLALCSILFLSCVQPQNTENKHGYYIDNAGNRISTQEIDGCEYIILNDKSIIHKANCKNNH